MTDDVGKALTARHDARSRKSHLLTRTFHMKTLCRTRRQGGEDVVKTDGVKVGMLSSFPFEKQNVQTGDLWRGLSLIFEGDLVL